VSFVALWKAVKFISNSYIIPFHKQNLQRQIRPCTRLESMQDEWMDSSIHS